MRYDMSKVIVERPRLRFPLKNGSAYPRGHLKNQWAPNFEDAPRIESMGGTYAKKWLNENLQPLVRFLRSRVGRLWDDVHSEISERISCKSAVQKHVLDHLRGYVQEHPIMVDGVAMRVAYRSQRPFLEPLVSYGMRFLFFVDPVSRALTLAPIASRKNRNRKNQPDPDRHVISREIELRRINGVWYEITVSTIPKDEVARARCFDVLERRLVLGDRNNDLWQSDRYAAKKRQLSTDEIVRHSLRRRR
jgi:hypothetical protein